MYELDRTLDIDRYDIQEKISSSEYVVQRGQRHTEKAQCVRALVLASLADLVDGKLVCSVIALTVTENDDQM